MNPWVRAFALDWIVIIAAFTAAFIWLPLWLAVPSSALVIGSRQHALAILAHDAAHRHAPKSMRALSFWIIGIDIWAYRDFHFAHHRLLGSPLDPELQLHKFHWDNFSWRCVAKDLLGFSARETLKIWRLAGGSYPILLGALCAIAIVETAVKVVLVTGFDARPSVVPWAVVVWLLAINTSFMACFRQRAIIEHGYAYRIRYLHKLVLFPHNCWYHEKHHKDPAIPFWSLSRGESMVS